MAQLFKNNCTGSLAASVSGPGTTLLLASGLGAGFPSPTGGDFFVATLVGIDANAAENAWEIVKCTARSADMLTVERGQEGTTAQAWPAGTRVDLRLTAESIERFKQGAIGDIKMTAAATAPDGWLFCHGQTVLIADYPLLFSAIGVVYGGDGVTTFGIPDLQDRVPVGASGTKSLGSNGGAASVEIVVDNMPAHSHAMFASQGTNGTISPSTGAYLSATAGGTQSAAAIYAPSATNPVQLAGGSSVGGGEELDVQNPYLSLNYIIYTGVA